MSCHRLEIRFPISLQKQNPSFGGKITTKDTQCITSNEKVVIFAAALIAYAFAGASLSEENLHINNNFLHLYSAFLCTQRTLHERG